MNNNYNNGYAGDFSLNNNKPNKKVLNKIIFWIGNVIIASIYIVCCVINHKYYSTVNSATASDPTGLDISLALPILFTYMGWWSFIAYPEKLRRKKEKCTQTVLALLKDYKVVEHSGDDGRDYKYYAIYEYEVNNASYSVTSKVEYEGKRKSMIQCKLLINPDNPSEIYEIENENARIRGERIGGIISIIFGLGFILLIFAVIKYF